MLKNQKLMQNKRNKRGQYQTTEQVKYFFSMRNQALFFLLILKTKKKSALLKKYQEMMMINMINKEYFTLLNSFYENI